MEKIKFDDKYNVDKESTIFANQYELGLKINELIDILGLTNKEVKNTEIPLHSGLVSLTAKIDKKRGRITLFAKQSQTELNFNNRKISTIEDIAKCMLQIVEIARKYPAIV